MSSDSTTTAIQQLIDECREQWATTGEGVLDLLWLRVDEGEALADFIYPDGTYVGNRESVTSLCLTAANGDSCNGVVCLPRIPESFRYFETKYERPHEIDFFDYISRHAGAFVISHCRGTLEPYLSSEGANQGDPRAWWIAYLWSQFGEVPKTKDDQDYILLINILFLTILALEQLEQCIDNEVTSPVAPSIEPKGTNTKEIPNGKDVKPSSDFWNYSPPQQQGIVRVVMEKGGRISRSDLEDSKGVFNDPPPIHRTLQRALNRVNDELSKHASGWMLEWSPNLMDIKAEVWLTSPGSPKTESEPVEDSPKTELRLN